MPPPRRAPRCLPHPVRVASPATAAAAGAAGWPHVLAGRSTVPRLDADGDPVQRRGDAAGTVDTARDGIFAPLEESGLTDCAAIVVRHWDGERLGLRRLVDAYQAVTRLALGQLPATEAITSGPATSAGAFAEASKEPCPEPREAGPELPEAAKLKEKRKVLKAMREIEKLEEQQEQGEKLRPNQVEKVGKKPEFARRLQELSVGEPPSASPEEVAPRPSRPPTGQP